MRLRTAFTAAATLMLTAACGSGPEVSAENATAEEVADQLAESSGSASFVRPGLWESKVTIEEMTMPGMSAADAARMPDFTGRVEAHQNCLTPEQAKRPKEDFFAGGNDNCRYDHFTMGGGKIDAVMKCSGQGMAQTMTMKGSYSADTYAMQMTMQGGSGPEAGLSMKMRVDAKRIGDCTAEQARAAAEEATETTGGRQ